MSTQSNGADVAGRIVFDALMEKAQQQGSVELKEFWQGATWENITPEVKGQCVHAAMALTEWLLKSPEVWAAFETRKLEKVGGGEQHDG